jgi:16S rRNA processing protein RimM
LLVRSETDVPGRLENVKSACVRFSNGEDLGVQVESSWQHGEHWVMKFAGVDSIDAAERFRGADLWVPLEGRASLKPGEFFQSDLIGFTVLNRATGEPIGPVEGWQAYGGPPLMEVTHHGKEVLIPFVPDLCDVSIESGTVTVDIPQGLLELD